MDDETHIVVRWRKGETRAFEYLVKKYMRKAYFIALGLVGQHDVALDLSQEAFVRVYHHRRKFDPNRRFFPWFYQILKNLCFNWLREQRANPHIALEDLREHVEKEGVSLSFDPDLLSERDAVKDRVWKAIASLKPRDREVIILRHFQNLTYREIAEVLSCSQGTVMSRLYYARRALKQKLELHTVM